MCFGGSDDSDSESDREKTNRFNRAKNRTVREWESSGDNQTNPIQSDDPTRDFETGKAYAENQAKLAGYGANNKGVVDSQGGAVLDGFGNPVQSGTYTDLVENSKSDFERKLEYDAARVKAVADFQATQSAATQNVSPALIEAGLGTSDLALKEGYSLTDASFGTQKATQKQKDAYTKMLAEAMRGNYLGTGTARFPDATFDDPLGTALGPTLSGTYSGSNLTARQQRENFARLSKAYNTSMFRQQLEVDAAGNIGTTGFGQRFARGLGNIVEGVVMGGVLGPVGSAAAIGTDYKVMNNYGTSVPGFGTGTTSTASFDYKNMLGGAAGDFIAGKTAPAVGKALYKQTGDVGASMAGAVGAGIITAEQGGQAIGGYLSDEFGLSPSIMSSDISPAYSTPKADRVNTGFSASIGSDDETKPVSTSELSTAANPDFDWQSWLAATSKQTKKPTDWTVSSTEDVADTPLFSAAPQASGVRLLSQRTNRDSGNAIVKALSRDQQYKRNRRSRLTG